MPGPVTIFTLGAVGVAGAAAIHRRSSLSNSPTEENVNGQNPINMARRRSSTVQPDHAWDQRKQPEYQWRREFGANFSHNSRARFPTNMSSSPTK
ncbi:hypothetical protein DM01DRAFT_1331542 [Hesseltinella vesiculosa]|uniref:Uncharacterized protein n=1 Tax=Hesseltinella vesiculosa TaxID=101127 RepID=A0A1X2GVQ2_9FUNG|nr:hypothetical protein DM01DRAFT_1331542 [Hesseltinella vesiculosa]